jgi:hypothetical protein
VKCVRVKPSNGGGAGGLGGRGIGFGFCVVAVLREPKAASGTQEQINGSK